jgi:electron transport complex protein RnfG
MKKILELGLRLAFVSALASGMLTYMYQITSPRIAANARRQKEEKLKYVLPGADRLETKVVEGQEIIIGYAGQNLVGVALQVSSAGYGGPIQLLVGVSPKGRAWPVAILSDKETPGLGKKIHDYWFRQQFVGKKAGQIQLKKDSPEGTIDAVSSATISSRAVSRGIRQAVEQAQDFFSQGLHGK